MNRALYWLERHAKAIQALSAILTVLLALAALIGVKMQINAAERQQQAQSARDIYREYLNLSIARPEFSRPDYCAIQMTPNEGAYEDYVEYLLYAAEQGIAADVAWRPVFESALEPHAAYLCTIKDWRDYSAPVRQLGKTMQADLCAAVEPCADE